MCPPEKSRDSDRFAAEQSVLYSPVCPGTIAKYGHGRLDSYLRYRSECARADVCVSYRDSISYRENRETAGWVMLQLCGKLMRFADGSKGEWLAILWLKVASTTPHKRPNWFARDCVPAAQSKSEKYLRRICFVKKRRAGDFRRFSPMPSDTTSATWLGNRRFTSVGLFSRCPSDRHTLRPDSEFVGRLSIKLPCDR